MSTHVYSRQALPLTPWQEAFVYDTSTFQHITGVPGSGRTYASCAKAVEYALSHSSSAVLYAVPVASHLYHVQRLLEMAAGPALVTSHAAPWSSEITLFTSSVICLRLIGSHTSILSRLFDAICVDDYDYCQPDTVRVLQGRLRSRDTSQMWITRRLRPGDRPNLPTEHC